MFASESQFTQQLQFCRQSTSIETICRQKIEMGLIWRTFQSNPNSIHSNINAHNSGSANFNINATHISVRSGGSISCMILPITLIRQINNTNHGHNSHNQRSNASVSVNVSVRSIGSSTITSAAAGTGSSSSAHGHGGLPVPVRHIQPQHSNVNGSSSLNNSSSLNSTNSTSRSALPVFTSPPTLLLLESQHRQMQSHDTDNGNNIHSSLGSGIHSSLGSGLSHCDRHHDHHDHENQTDAHDDHDHDQPHPVFTTLWQPQAQQHHLGHDCDKSSASHSASLSSSSSMSMSRTSYSSSKSPLSRLGRGSSEQVNV
jgi:hypothetical protein